MNEIHESAERFVAEVKALSSHYNEDSTLNTDQLDRELEVLSTRTLSFQGEKTTLATVRSISNTTRSYTVQCAVSMGGKIVGPLHACLKEVNDWISENTRTNLLQMKNVVATCRASGKLSASLVEYWYDMCLILFLPSRQILLLSDSWPGQTDHKDTYEPIKGCTQLAIPWKTTSRTQPIDMFFNRQRKVIVCKAHEEILLGDIIFNFFKEIISFAYSH